MIHRILAGDAGAEGDFVDVHRPRLLRITAHFLGMGCAEADDVVLETFRTALSELARRVPAEPVYVWLRRICLRLCYARLRERGRSLDGAGKDLEAFLVRRGREDAGAGDEASAAGRVRFEGPEPFVAVLDPGSRRILALRVRGMSYTGISRTLDMPLGTVLARLAGTKDRILRMEGAIPYRKADKHAG